MKSRALQVTFLALLLTTACNKDEFVGMSISTEGIDSSCEAGSDVISCEAISGCQAAFEDVESVEPVFASCIADPESDPEVVIMDPPDDSDPNSPSPEEPVVEDDKEPTIADAYANNCEDLDDKYLLIKKVSGEGKSHKSKKVKVCHQCAKSEHTIIVACPALKAHRKHDDYLGACKAD